MKTYRASGIHDEFRLLKIKVARSIFVFLRNVHVHTSSGMGARQSQGGVKDTERRIDRVFLVLRLHRGCRRPGRDVKIC